MLLRAAGFGEQPPPAREQELLPVLRGHAEAFLEAGGLVSLAEWVHLSPLERMAMAAAGRRLRVQQAVRAGRAAQGDLAAMEVQAELDGGRGHAAAALRAVVDHVAAERRQARGL